MGVPELIVILFALLNLTVFVMSTRYVLIKTRLLQKKMLYHKTWVIVVLHIFAIVSFDVIVGIISSMLPFFLHALGCLIVPFYLRSKVRQTEGA